MNVKIGLSVACTMFIVIVLFNVPSMFAQERTWDSCQISAYGTDIEEEFEVNLLRFTAVVPPTGSEITNSIEVMDLGTGENVTINLSDGDRVSLIYEDVIYQNVEVAPEANHYTITYDGGANFISVNSVEIPEFASIVIIPMFMIATLIALVYRRKRSS